MKKIKLFVLCAIFVFAAVMSACGQNAKGEVYVYSYGDYYDPVIADDFENETGIKVIPDTYDTAEEMYPIIKNSSANYDVVCTSDYMIEKMIKEDLIAELDKNNIPNVKNIDPLYMKKSEEFDPENKYSIPHAVGVAGILYNKKMTDGAKIDSWKILWDKRFKKSIVMPDSVRDDFMIALRKLGYSGNTTNETEIRSAALELKKQKPLVYKYANDSARDLIADGSAAIGVVWNGEYVYTNALNPDVEFTVPKEGSEAFIDSWVIPKNAKNKKNAEKWINYLCKAKVAKMNFDYLYYTTPNKAAYKFIDKKYSANESVFPSAETVDRCSSIRALDDKTMKLYSDCWKDVKAN